MASPREDRPALRPALQAGQSVTIVKTHRDKELSHWEYPATVIPFDKGDWIAVEAAWGRPDADIDGVKFITGGKIREFFSPTKRYNIFQVFAPDGAFTGIYANITAPTSVDCDEDGRPVLTWEDHWLDAVRLPDGTIKVLDEDEYQESGIPDSNFELHHVIQQALAELLNELSAGQWDG